MSTEKSPLEQTSPAVAASCRKKKSESATFLEDVRDHIDEFIHASMDEHKSCFKKTINKMFGMSKIVAERNKEAKEVESSLPLQTIVSDYMQYLEISSEGLLDGGVVKENISKYTYNGGPSEFLKSAVTSLAPDQ